MSEDWVLLPPPEGGPAGGPGLGFSDYGALLLMTCGLDRWRGSSRVAPQVRVLLPWAAAPDRCGCSRPCDGGRWPGPGAWRPPFRILFRGESDKWE
ncbi:hypothetical protein NDU88_006768 [Pleurodeles waltl]|uniref:Uncharacterized protein n=1 Tax=Pleurodeles waltl TaxID=8319 RepID=A0AAV7SQJ9_PLEWA|nr:hypothetical protein NDU88_006768 [Pleurodeles waltl]